MKRENEEFRSRRNENDDILFRLRTLPEEEALDLLMQLRSNSDFNEARDQSDNNNLVFNKMVHQSAISQQLEGLLCHVLPPAPMSVEFELMIRHPVSYPPLYLPDASIFRGKIRLVCRGNNLTCANWATITLAS